MQRGSLVAQFADRTNPLGKHLEVMNNKRGMTKVRDIFCAGTPAAIRISLASV